MIASLQLITQFTAISQHYVYMSCTHNIITAKHLALSVMASSHHSHGQDKTVLSCPCECKQYWRQVKTVFSSPHCISRPDKTVLKFSVADSLDLSPSTRTGQDKTLLSCPCRRCELGITQLAIYLSSSHHRNLIREAHNLKKAPLGHNSHSSWS